MSSYNVGDTCFGICDEYFEYECWEEALEAKWDQAEPDEKTLIILEGQLGPGTFYSDEYDAELMEVIKVKTRKFVVLKDDDCFDLEHFEEIIEA